MITAQNSKKNRQNQYTGMLVHTRKKKQDLIVPLLQVPVRQFWFRPMASTNKHSSATGTLLSTLVVERE